MPGTRLLPHLGSIAAALFLLTTVAACGDGSGHPAAVATFTAAATAVPATATSVPSHTPPLPSPSHSATAVPSNTPSATASSSATATDSHSPIPSATPPATATNTATATPTGLQAHASVEQIWIIGAQPGAQLDLRVDNDDFNIIVRTASADAQGSLIFRNVPPNAYVVTSATGERSGAVYPFTAENHPPFDSSLYQDQRIERGYGYLRTRDGTLLAINVLMPGPESEGPYPTVIEYSGYDPANPTTPQPSTLIASNIGYAVVGVNMRGTGCSGGAFDYFETLQSTDGYDVVETIAAQPWVKFHQPGMVGLSYPGITQLFVAQTQPPHLAAIAPLSVVSDLGQGILYPGGILNNGFAVEWAAGRQHDARPGGQEWSQKRMDEGDQTCIDNQRLRAQSPDILQRVEDTPYYDPAIVDPLSPTSFVHRIQVPVYLAGAWQDEQTGGYFPNMIANFTGTQQAHFTLQNGGHTDSLSPPVFSRWLEFLSLYVAREIPRRALTVQTILQVLATGIFDVRRLTIEPERFNDVTTFEEALARFESDPRVRVLFENGAGNPAVPGAPVPTFEGHFDSWPVPGLQASTWYFDADGKLSAQPTDGAGADSYRYDTSRAQQTTIEGGDGDIWKALPPWNWRPLAAGKAIAYASEPLTETLVMAGSGSVDLWFESTASDVDLQVTLSEIRPDGNETLVQSGWLRASQRKLDESLSSVLRPQHTHRAVDVEPLPLAEFVPLRVELFPFAHVFRPGSRIRIAVGTPGGTRPRWKFRVLEPDGEVTNTVARSAAMPSRVVLPVIPDLVAPAQLPACPSLRGQPCRVYEEWSND